MDFLAGIRAWAGRPFRSEMNVGNWFLFVGLLIVAAIFWKLVLREIQEG